MISSTAKQPIRVTKILQYSKWLIIILIAAVLIIYGRTVNSPSLTKTQIVLGVGIDFFEETREFEVTTQSMVVASTYGSSDAKTTYNVYTARGKTVAEALDGISRKIGLNISLAHCNVLFLSTSTFRLDHLQLFYPLTGMYSLPEQSTIVCSSVSPKELLAKRIGTTVSSALFLQNTLVNQEGDDGMIRTTVKDFLASSLSKSHANALPYIEVKELEVQPQNSDGEIKDNFELILNRAIVLNENAWYIIDEKRSEVLSIYLSSNANGTIGYTSPNGESVEFKTLSENVSLSADGRTVYAQVKLSVDLLDVQFVNSDKVLTGADEIIQNFARALETDLEERLLSLFETSKEQNIDFLGLQQKAYESVGRTLEDDCLHTLTFIPDVQITVSESA
ncbi:MAG: hypothetical protein J5713_04825 [Clostridia bacterium]|nr:hypothetical protein [Clostridia bacterium]